MKKTAKYCVVAMFSLILFANTAVMAQPGGGPGPPQPPGLAPIDGGVLILLVSGLILGVYNLRKKKE